MGSSSPIFGVNIKNSCNHHLVQAGCRYESSHALELEWSVSTKDAKVNFRMPDWNPNNPSHIFASFKRIGSP